MEEYDNEKKKKLKLHGIVVDAEVCEKLGLEITDDGGCEGKIDIDKLISILLEQEQKGKR